MIIGVPKEIYPGERRVALVPAVLPTLTKAGFEVHVQAGAGIEAGYPDSQYSDKGAKIIADRPAVFSAADIIVQVLCYGSNDITGKEDVPLFRRDQILVGFLRPFGERRGRRRTSPAPASLVFGGTDAAYHSRPEHGRAFVDGHDLRLQGGAGRRVTPISAFFP